MSFMRGWVLDLRVNYHEKQSRHIFIKTSSLSALRWEGEYNKKVWSHSKASRGAKQSRRRGFFDITTTTKAPECAEYQWSSHSQSRRISLRALCSVGCGGVLFTQQYLCCTTYCCCHAYSHQRQRLTAQRQQHQASFLAAKQLSFSKYQWKSVKDLPPRISSEFISSFKSTEVLRLYGRGIMLKSVAKWSLPL